MSKKQVFMYILGVLLILTIPLIDKFDFLTGSDVAYGRKMNNSECSLQELGYLSRNNAQMLMFELDGEKYKCIGPDGADYAGMDDIEIRYSVDDPEVCTVNTLAGLFFNNMLALVGLLMLLWTAYAFTALK